MRRTGETARQWSIARKHALAAALGLVALASTLSITRAADCPPEPQQHLPQAPPPPLNIDKVKDVLLAYQAENYDGDIAAVFAAARAYVEGRAGQVSKPALVLDIDETSLSNWSNLKANNFGFIADGTCDRLPSGPCGFKAWILQGVAPPIKPALDLFNAAKAKARPDDDPHPTVEAYKTEERRKLAEAGYTIIATVGDQQSDLDGGFAECTFKVPNPFYFIP